MKGVKLMMKRRRAMLRTLVLWMLAFCFALPSAAFAAKEEATVTLPVIARGADCTAVLWNTTGYSQTLSLQKDTQGQFVVRCKGLGAFTYKVNLSYQDTADVTYDKTVYEVTIYVYYNAAEQIEYVFTVSDGETTAKPDALEFVNKPCEPEPTPTPTPEPTPTPTPRPTPTPTPTPVPYNQYFTFSKIWQGDHEESIDWVMFNPDGSVRHKLFNKIIVSDTEWRYEAWFQATEDISSRYIVETPPEGYMVRYENVGSRARYTDRCYNGGTIINYKVPKTEDPSALPLHAAMTAAGLLGAALLVWRRRRRRKDQPGT